MLRDHVFNPEKAIECTLFYAVGLSRLLYGLTIATERREHRMAETWHPLGVTGIISAFTRSALPTNSVVLWLRSTDTRGNNE